MNRFRADMLLLMVTLVWGLSYLAMNYALVDLEPFTLNAYRFVGAFFVIALFSVRRLRHANAATFRAAVAAGLLMAGAYITITFGVKYTTVSNAAFLCALTVLFIPLLELLLFRRKPPAKIFLSVALCILGVFLLTAADGFSADPVYMKGNIYSLLCAVFNAAEILCVSHAVQDNRVDAFNLGLIGMGVTGAATLAGSLILETPRLPSHTPAIVAVVFLSLFCSGLPGIIQPIAQQYTDASHVGVIYTLEPVFAGIAAFLLQHEILTWKGYLGEALTIAALLLMEIHSGKEKEAERNRPLV